MRSAKRLCTRLGKRSHEHIFPTPFEGSWTPPRTSRFQRELSAKADDLTRLNAIVNFELFRLDLVRAVPRGDGAKGGQPAFDHVFMFKALVLPVS